MKVTRHAEGAAIAWGAGGGHGPPIRSGTPASGEARLVQLTLPKKRVSFEQLAVHATGMADTAAMHANVFTASGLLPDFADRLRAAAAEMLELTAEYKQNTYKSKQAGTDLRTQLSRGRKVIQMLDALMKSAFAENPGLLDAWNMAKRVQKKGYPSPATDTTAAPSATTVAA